jgi:hypothetical protein
MAQTQEQLTSLFTDLTARLKKYQPGESVSFHWVFDSNEALAAFEADARFVELFGECEKEKNVQVHTMKPILKWLVRIPTNARKATAQS